MIDALWIVLLGMAIVFAVLIVFSHYSATIIAIGIVTAVLGVTLLWKRLNLNTWYGPMKPYLITICVLIVLTGVWHFNIARYSGSTMFNTMLRPEKAKAIMGEDWGNFDVLDMSDRDVVAQKAFGLTLADEPIPSKIEIATNWLVVMFITLGLYVVARRKEIDLPFKTMLITFYGLVLATIAIPQISIYYGTQRVYSTALVVLATCFPFGIRWLASKLHSSTLAISIPVLTLYGLSVSGLLYLPFGLTKILPYVAILQ
jgi:hypothetical protein